MIIKVVEGENLPPMCYHFPDGAEISQEQIHPLRGFYVIKHDDKVWIFNPQYVVAIVPDSMYPLREVEIWRSV